MDGISRRFSGVVTFGGKKMAEKVGWGILGPGRIAAKFAEDLKNVQDAQLVGVASRSRERATEFAAKHGVIRAHWGYDTLIADPGVDIVYVSTPHPFHYEHVIACLEGGKAVLCEKPLGINANQVLGMVDYVRERGLFLMEGMWTRFLPVTEKVQEWLRWGVIGKTRMLSARMGFRTEWNPAGRLLNPKLAGGALLDVGVYLVAYASMVFGGIPESIRAFGHIGETGVDEQTGMVFGYEDGAIAMLVCGIRTQMASDAEIYGEKGLIRVNSFSHASHADLFVNGLRPVEFGAPAGFRFEAAEAMRCLRAGQMESRALPLDESVAIAKTMDRVREQIGLQYPMETARDS